MTGHGTAGTAQDSEPLPKLPNLRAPAPRTINSNEYVASLCGLGTKVTLAKARKRLERCIVDVTDNSHVAAAPDANPIGRVLERPQKIWIVPARRPHKQVRSAAP